MYFDQHQCIKINNKILSLLHKIMTQKLSTSTLTTIDPFQGHHVNFFWDFPLSFTSFQTSSCGRLSARRCFHYADNHKGL